ncbi:phage tail tube protein [Saccharibacter floricola]|uniref:Phage tail tube protein n=1 Tax=Saccharibacter floricola DSM 15669 TaxID=1123227 RepID=A0ABQ0P0M9_9PROT|nr:phage tail tube protein [Saccharibacter floricola]GBQ08011.1 phage tail tube protein [Saccharibacter floricola DSM 15669]
MAAIRRGPLAGWASFTINGEVWNVVGDLEYRPSGMTNETLKGQSAVEGFGQMPVEGEISANIRDRDDKRIADLQGASGFTIIAELANGKVVTGSDMWQVENLTVSTQESTFKLTFHGTSVIEETVGGTP